MSTHSRVPWSERFHSVDQSNLRRALIGGSVFAAAAATAVTLTVQWKDLRQIQNDFPKASADLTFAELVHFLALERDYFILSHLIVLRMLEPGANLLPKTLVIKADLEAVAGSSHLGGAELEYLLGLRSLVRPGGVMVRGIRASQFSRYKLLNSVTSVRMVSTAEIPMELLEFERCAMVVERMGGSFQGRLPGEEEGALISALESAGYRTIDPHFSSVAVIPFRK
jgi:hypothetical protein